MRDEAAEAVNGAVNGGLDGPSRGDHPLGKRQFALRPDAQAFDEVRITTIPRFKTSGLSGDEWRISAKIEFLRKGVVVHEDHYNSLEYAISFLPFVHARAVDDGHAYFGGGIEDKCDQEGCSEIASVLYRRKMRYCDEGHPHEDPTPQHRQFCAKHKNRGDSALDDCMQNYEEVSFEQVR